MEELKNKPEDVNPQKGSARIVVVALSALISLWFIWLILGFIVGEEPSKESQKIAQKPAAQVASKKSAADKNNLEAKEAETSEKDAAKAKAIEPAIKKKAGSSSSIAKKQASAPAASATLFGKIRGINFVEACIAPLDHELNERFWGWRPNDIVELTDNVNNLQLGVLEVTRRSSFALAEKISRSSSTDAYVPSLEYAMNWFMIKPTKYWFPSAESKYQEGLDELRAYIGLLKKGKAKFYIRVDNLVPLLKAYESILGSCNENLVKNVGEMSWLDADNHFYYAKGVTSSMVTILEALAKDYNSTISSVQGGELIRQVINSLHQAAEIEPIIVLEGSPGSILANHRANMAAPINHARVYLGVLIMALTGNI